MMRKISLSALLLLPLVASGQSADEDLLQGLKELYTAGEYELIIENVDTSDSSITAPVLAMVALANVRVRDIEGARLIETRMKADFAESPYTSAVAQSLITLSTRQATQEAIRAAIESLDYSEVRRAIDESDLTPDVRTALRIRSALMAGRFEEAEEASNDLPFADRVTTGQLIDEARTKLASELEAVDEIVFNPLVPGNWAAPSIWSSCVYSDPFPGLFSTVDSLITAFPLHEEAMNWAFFMALFAGSDEVVVELADKILGSGHVIRLPFFGRESWSWLTIDRGEGRVELVPSDRPFAFYWCEGLEHLGLETRRRGTDQAPFSYSYAQINRIEQRMKGNSEGSLRRKSYMLKINRDGVASAMSLIGAMHALYGESAQKSVSRRLGELILRELEPRQIDAKLSDPEKVSGGVLRAFLTAGAVLSAASSLDAAASGDLATMQSMTSTTNAYLMMSAGESFRASLAQQGLENWTSGVSDVLFDEALAPSIEDIEAILFGE